MKDNITKLLGLEDVIVKNVYEDDDGGHIEISLPRRKHCCPRFGSMTDRIHDYREQKVKDLDVQVHISAHQETKVCLQRVRKTFL
jgi:transposase